MQKNWIGKSFGCEINFQLTDNENKIKVFTTRPDTIYGASFLALSVDHPLSKNFLKISNFQKFKDECSKTGTTEEALANAEKIGYKTGLFVNHPFIKNKKSTYEYRNYFCICKNLFNFDSNKFDIVLFNKKKRIFKTQFSS